MTEPERERAIPPPAVRGRSKKSVDKTLLTLVKTAWSSFPGGVPGKTETRVASGE
jgi:hypothetical protein